MHFCFPVDLETSEADIEVRGRNRVYFIHSNIYCAPRLCQALRKMLEIQKVRETFNKGVITKNNNNNAIRVIKGEDLSVMRTFIQDLAQFG